MAEVGLKDAIAAAPEVVLRRATPADTRQMIELVRIAIGRGSVPRTEAFWRWKHEHNPFGPSPAMVAEADGRIVSLRIFLRWRWLYGKYAYAAVRPVDTATHPDWRRRGLFERLTRELLQVMKSEGVAFRLQHAERHERPRLREARLAHRGTTDDLGAAGQTGAAARRIRPARGAARPRRGAAAVRGDLDRDPHIARPCGLRKTHLPQQVPSHDRRRCRLPRLALPRLPWARLRRDGRVRPHLGRT